MYLLQFGRGCFVLHSIKSLGHDILHFSPNLSNCVILDEVVITAPFDTEVNQGELSYYKSLDIRGDVAIITL